MTYNQIIEDANLSVAWARSLEAAYSPKKREIVPLIVSITGFDSSNNVIEDPSIRGATDKCLTNLGEQSIETVANTIFPYSLWNPKATRTQLFQRYSRAFPRIQKSTSKNRNGVYFDRMISGGNSDNPNQLDFIIDTYKGRDAVRRGMLQVSTFNPQLDHSKAAQRGFPCLQHVTFAPSGNHLSVNAFYASQYIVKKAYGNYLGLCRLGQFVAHELGLKLSRVTCYTGISIPDVTAGSIDDIRTVHKKLASKSGGK